MINSNKHSRKYIDSFTIISFKINKSNNTSDSDLKRFKRLRTPTAEDDL